MTSDAASSAFPGWPSILTSLLAGRDLDSAVAEAAISEILNGDATPSQLTAFIVALRAKGETADELAGMLRAVRLAGTRVQLAPDVAARAIDIVGTGGDSSHSVNVSTMSAFVVAGAGVPVCKHGSRASSSMCGSADVLEALGVSAEIDAPGVERCIEVAGMGFCLAARFHPAFRHSAASRREIGIPTAFNLLGPMSNPAPIANMLVGVANPDMRHRMAAALSGRGVTSAWLVHGDGGLDELSVSGPNFVTQLRDGDISDFVVDASEIGIARSHLEDVRGGEPAHNARIVRELLAGSKGAVRDIVVFNSAAALVVARVASTLAEAATIAEQSIDSGAAATVLELLVKESAAAAARMAQ